MRKAKITSLSTYKSFQYTIKSTPFLVLAICLFSSCSQFDNKQLVGNWKAVNVLQEGNAMELDPEDIQFYFDKNGQYVFNGTVGYKEAGTYSLTGDLLLSKDTIDVKAKEKAVKILQLQQDTLKLEMLANGKEQTIHLVKQ